MNISIIFEILQITQPEQRCSWKKNGFLVSEIIFSIFFILFWMSVTFEWVKNPFWLRLWTGDYAEPLITLLFLILIFLMLHDRMDADFYEKEFFKLNIFFTKVIKQWIVFYQRKREAQKSERRKQIIKNEKKSHHLFVKVWHNGEVEKNKLCNYK